MKLRAKHTGFTLIELMAVVAIVAVLAMIAYPAYQSYLIRANRAEAKALLMDLAQKQQLYFNDTRTYAEFAVPTLVSTLPERVEDNYVVAVNIGTTLPPLFSITATPQTGTPQEGDGILSIDQSGEKLHGTEPW